MSVSIPTIEISNVPLPQFIPRSRREEITRDTANARNLELQRSAAPIQQSFFRPEPAGSAFGPKVEARHNDQKGMASRNRPPTSVPAPSFDPAGPKLVGNVFFDQYAPEYDPRNVVRELRGSVKDDKATRGELESQRILSRGFSSRYVPQGFAENNNLNTLEAFEQLRPKMDDLSKQYRNFD
jgi:hypothetical protein